MMAGMRVSPGHVPKLGRTHSDGFLHDEVETSGASGSKSCAQPGAPHRYCTSTFFIDASSFPSASLFSRLQ